MSVALRFADRVKETSTTTGTGDFTLAGAATGYQTFNSAFGTDVRFIYVIEGGAEWEVGEGYLSTSTTLERETIISSSNSNNAVNFSASTKNVFCTPHARFTSAPTRGRVLAAAMNQVLFR